MTIENPTGKQLKTLTWIIYAIVNKITGKMYIGQTYKSFYGRYSSKWWKIRKRERNRYINNALNKHGYENFEIWILEYNVSNKEELNNLENFYIKKYNSLSPNGYNLQDGGLTGSIISEETREKLRIKNLKRYNYNYKIRDKDGNIYEFSNLEEFAKKMNIIPQNLRRVIWGKTKSCSIYKFHLLSTDLRKPQRNSKIYKVQDKDGKVYEIYNLKEFAIEHDLCYTTLYKTAMGKCLSCGNKFYPLEIKLKRKRRNKYKTIFLEKNNQIFKITNIKKFCEENKIDIFNIYRMIVGKIKIYKGFTLIKVIFNENYLDNLKNFN